MPHRGSASRFAGPVPSPQVVVPVPVSPTFPSSPPPPLSSPPNPPTPPSWSFPPPAPCPPGADTPAIREVPRFPPVRVRGGRYGPLRLLRRRGRVVAVGLAVAAAALVAAGARPGAGPPVGGPARAHPARSADPPPGGTHGLGTEGLGTDGVGADAGRTVTAPVRIADAETVRLLRPGDRVDVIAAGDPATDGTARVLARGARVARVPQPVTGGAARGGAGADWAGVDGAGLRGTESGALVALRVPRATAARLAGASATTRLAVTLW